jgi:type I restriction enzyme S subunit
MRMSDWCDCKLGDLLQIKHGFAFLGEHFASRGTHVVLTPGNFREEGGFKEKADKAKWYNGPIPEDYVLNGGDLIVAMTEQAEGLLGSSALIPRGGVYLHNQRLGLVQIRDQKQADKHFIYYLFNSIPVRQQIRGSASGTKIRHTAPSRIADVKVRIPPLPVQKRIAGILSAYDELIENNQRRIKILEAMARGLYREWFVHFRFPGHEGHRRVASAMDEIPEGWETSNLDALIKSHIGGGWGKDVYEDGFSESAWVIRGTDIPDARYSQFKSVPLRFHSQSNLRSRRLKSGDIVFEVSGGSKGQPVGRSLLITPELLTGLEGDVICASFCKRVEPDPDRIGSELLYLSFVEGYESGEIEQYQVQSTGISNFKWTEYIANTARAVPPKALQDEFRKQVAPIFRQVATIGLTIQNLRRTRDLLLPRLLSGQIDVAVT